MIAVLIGSSEREELRRLGMARNGMKDPSWSRRRSDIFTDAEVDALGLYGEWSVAHYLGLDINREVMVCGDGGVDLGWRGYDVSVKYNHRWKGYLMFEGRSGDDVEEGVLGDLRTDLVVLSHGLCRPPLECRCRDEGSMWVVVAGWLWRGEFLERMVVRNWGYGVRYVVGVENLRPMHGIWSV